MTKTLGLKCFCGNPGETMSTAVDSLHISRELVEAATKETPADLSFDPTLTNSKNH